MELVVLGAINLASVGYIGINTRRYLQFMKFKENKYIDKFHLIEGNITSSHFHHSFTHSYTGRPVDNLVMSRFQVDIGKNKIGTRFVSVPTNNGFVSIPQQYHYVDWKTTHDQTKISKDIELINVQPSLRTDDKRQNAYLGVPVKLLLQEAKWHYTQNSFLKENKTHLLGDLFRLFDKNKITYQYGDKVKMTEEFIQQQDHVVVVGEYRNENKQMQVIHIGNIDQVFEGVKNDICKFSEIGVGLASSIIVLTILCLIISLTENGGITYNNTKSF